MSDARRAGMNRPVPPPARGAQTPPRSGSASSLIKATRPAPATEPERAVEVALEAKASPAPAPTEAPPVSAFTAPEIAATESLTPETEAPRRMRSPEKRAKAKKTTLTVELPVDLRARVRATFRATKDIEGPEFFAQFMAQLLEQECDRREALYNGGQPFPDGDKMLPRGRPFA